MFLKLKIFIYNLLFIKLKLWWLFHFNSLIRTQLTNPNSIPVIIINFNQLYYLKKLVDFLVHRRFENIIIIDNKSTYPPLLEYYKNVPPNVKVELMADNYGHMVFFENPYLQKKYGEGFYVITDADIVPNENLPEDFMKVMLDVLLKDFDSVNKVGFALDINNIPDYYIFKDTVLKWESQFWKNLSRNTKHFYDANIDTTFALYKPSYPVCFNNNDFFKGIRLANNFTAKHGGWYLNEQDYTEEQEYYKASASDSSSWRISESKKLTKTFKNFYQ